jgi:hypothetical protein
LLKPLKRIDSCVAIKFHNAAASQAVEAHVLHLGGLVQGLFELGPAAGGAADPKAHPPRAVVEHLFNAVAD